MRYFTADLHLGHELVAELRGFASVEEHDDAVMAPLLELSADDQVWVLGDISSGSGSGVRHALELLRPIAAKQLLVLGNHDSPHPMHRDAHRHQRKFLDVFEAVQPFARLSFGPRRVLLSHFPYQGAGDRGDVERYTQYRLPDEGMWLLHGHTHAEQARSGERSICVSLDAWAMSPVPDTVLMEIITEGSPS